MSYTIDLNKPASSHNPFLVPDGYFSRFTEDLMTRIRSQVVPISPELRIVRWIPFIGAACVAALTILFSTIVPTESTDTASVFSPSVSSAEMQYADAAYDYLMLADANYLDFYEAEY